jgi:hypothetical protein
MTGKSRFGSVRRAAGWVAPALALSVLVGCGGDDTVAAGQPKEEVRDYCAKSLIIETYPEPEMNFEASPEEMAAEMRTVGAQILPLAEQAQAVAPAEIRKDIEVLVAATRQLAQTGDFEAAFGTEAVDEAEKRAHAFDLENCKWAKVEVSAKEYSFSGVPKKIEPGPVSFELANDGKEPHELMLLKVNEGETATAKEIVELPQMEAMSKIIPLGSTFAEPGRAEYKVIDLERGRYVIACFIPVGGGGEGPPHASRGMYGEFEVA